MVKISRQEAGRLGALRRNLLFGNPATENGRRKGGYISYRRFLVEPNFALKKGFKLEKSIGIPQRSPILAELIGILLGDGSINNYQVRVYFNAKTDLDYANFVKEIFFQLFDLTPNIAVRPKNTLELTVSSSRLVRFLLQSGLKSGDKIKHEADVPGWVNGNKEYEKACLRGLMDTDGGVYFHNHTTKGIKYRNMALCFTSRSLPLLKSAYYLFSSLGIKAKSNLKERVIVYNRNDINRYMAEVSSHNPNFLNRFNSYNGSDS